MVLLEIHRLNAGYDDLQVLKDVDVSLDTGGITVLMGPNGAGKSTLLKSIFNLTSITGGRITFDGEDITRGAPHELLAKGIAFVSQGRINFGALSVRDNLLMGLYNFKNKIEIENKIKEVYNQFSVLKEKQYGYAFTLSGGEQQMLAMGRALMSSPRLLLLDEPSLGLSPKLVKEVFKMIKEIRDHFHTTILIVEHNLKSLMDIADDGYVMVQGEIVAHDRCEVLKKSDIMKKVFVGTLE